tara:strand:- start:4873 stop:6552 length:1680 start_codon:yes stop_codon:yes gene_type:complete
MPYRKFYNRHGLKGVLYGDDSQLKERHIWLLNVSATPFSELVCNEKVKKDCLTDDERSIIGDIPLTEKSVIFAKPGLSYKGISEFLDNNIHFTAERISDDDCESGHVEGVLKKDKYNNKYCIIRTSCAGKDSELMKVIAKHYDCEYKSVFATSSKEDPSLALDFLKDKPDKKTLVHICGKARMGQVLDKSHIGFVYEQTQNPNTDTILQGLLGRMCGYYDTPIPDIFLSPKTKAAVKKYAEAWDQEKIEELFKIRRAMNLKGSNKHTSGKLVKDKDNKLWIKTVPIQFTIDDCKDDGEASFTSTDKNEIINMFQDKPELIEGNPDSDKIQEMIVDWPCSKRNIDEESYKERGPGGIKLSFENASRDSIRETCWFTNCVTEHPTSKVIPFQIIGSNKTEYNPEGKVFLIGFIPYEPSIHGDMDTSLPNVKPKANYAISSVEAEDGSVIENINGGQVIAFPFATSSDPKMFINELVKAIERTDPSHPTYIEGCQQSIMSMHDKPSSAPKGIALSIKVYNENEIKNIVREIERVCKVKLTLKKSRGRQPSGYIRYSSISWKF